MTATNDDLIENPAETIVVSLGTPLVTEGSASITGGQGTATATINDIDQAIEFSVVVDDEGAEAQGQAVGISEEDTTDDAATFTVAVSALNTGNSASVVLSFPGTATDGTDYSAAIESAIASAIGGLPAGHGVSYDAGTNTLSFDNTSGTGVNSLSFTVTATNDDFVENPAETIVVSLGTPLVDEGSASITGGQGTATATINDIDNAITFAISVVSEDVADDAATQQATITEENGLDDLATFTITVTGFPLTGSNTASIDVDFTGTTDDADFVTTALASLQAVADATSGVSLTGNTLTFDSAFAGSTLDFSVEADDDGADEGPEDLIATLSNEVIDNGSVSIVSGQDAATVDLLDNDADFPAGLAYSIAGGGGTGAFLYGIDLATGATFQIGAVVVNGNDKAQFSSLTLNPVDGYLYGLADQGSLNGFVRVNAATGEAELLASNSLFNTSTSGMAFDSGGNLFMAINKSIYQIDAADLDSFVIGDLTLVSRFTNGGVKVDSMAYDEASGLFYFVSGSQLYSIANGAIGVSATAIGTGIGDTIDGLSFDESGTLWGADNLGTIYRIDTTSGTGELVATISNSDVTNSGIHSLAISQVLPGTYVTLGEGAGSHTEYYVFNVAAVNDVLKPANTGLATHNDVNVSITGRTISVTQADTGNPVDSVAIRVDASADITVDGFDQTDVFTRDGAPSNVVITNAEGGTIQTGEATDTVTITSNTASGGVTADETYTVTTDGGDDVITLDDLVDSTYIINAGEALDANGNLAQDLTDIDTVVIDDSINLGAGRLSLSNVEILDIAGTGNNTLTLSAADVLAASDVTNTLIIHGDTGDALASSNTWAAGPTGVIGIDGGTYNTYTSGLATLLVDASINTDAIVD